MHHFNHTISNRLKFVYFIRLLLLPRSRINKCQIVTNFNTNRPPCKRLREDKSYHTYHANRRKRCEHSARIFCTYFRVNRGLSSRSPINSLQGGGLYQNIIISLHRKSQGLNAYVTVQHDYT